MKVRVRKRKLFNVDFKNMIEQRINNGFYFWLIVPVFLFNMLLFNMLFPAGEVLMQFFVVYIVTVVMFFKVVVFFDK